MVIYIYINRIMLQCFNNILHFKKENCFISCPHTVCSLLRPAIIKKEQPCFIVIIMASDHDRWMKKISMPFLIWQLSITPRGNMCFWVVALFMNRHWMKDDEIVLFYTRWGMILAGSQWQYIFCHIFLTKGCFFTCTLHGDKIWPGNN